jgi:hypothetical protein
MHNQDSQLRDKVKQNFKEGGGPGCQQRAVPAGAGGGRAKQGGTHMEGLVRVLARGPTALGPTWGTVPIWIKLNFQTEQDLIWSKDGLEIRIYRKLNKEQLFLLGFFQIRNIIWIKI